MKSEVKVLIIEDHPAMGYGTKMILEQIETLRVIGIAESGAKGIEMLNQYVPHLVILDINLPDKNGKELAKTIKDLYPKTKMIIYTAYDYIPFLNSFLDIGISGVIHKNASTRQILRAVECVLDGETILPQEVFQLLRLSDEVVHQHARGREIHLTELEHEIMMMVCNECTVEEIAANIQMSKRTAQNYLTKIYEKLGVQTNTGAAVKFTKEFAMGK